VIRLPAAIGALFGMTAVLLGAFGAHVLEARVSAERLEVWATASHYLAWHATTLLFVGLGTGRKLNRWLLSAAAWCLTVGIAVFSGSLYLLVLTDQAGWGAVTPIGGVLLAIGWAFLAAAIAGARPETS
jgi:uncharacterized membrane protein YgdD (TMEM256/DUF423 family)